MKRALSQLLKAAFPICGRQFRVFVLDNNGQKMLAIFGALEEELSGLKKAILIRRIEMFPECRVYEGKQAGKDVLVVVTGVGKNKSIKAAKRYSKYPVSQAISAGFGGGLDPRMEAGDVVIYSQILCADGQLRGTDSAGIIRSNSDLYKIASQLTKNSGYQVLKGDGVAVREVCATPHAKLKLGEEYEASITDMESYWIGRAAWENEVPFLAVRSVFDTVRDDVSFLEHISREGQIKVKQAIGYSIGHPWQLIRLASYAGKAVKARNNLTDFLTKLIKKL
jgi:adenosylhomocysteine nucleosidase